MDTSLQSSDTCPECARTRPTGQGCLHCAMAMALAAAPPDEGTDLPDSGLGFASFADPVLPMELGHFRLLTRLGIGGMGTVYEAEDVALDRTVAVKMIRGFRFSSSAETIRFQREARAAAKLDHPNIVPIYEVGALDGLPFLAMKRIRGETLAHRLLAGAMPAAEAARIMRKVAAAVHHAHERGVLHCDLKPSNVLLDEAGEPWLTDFGMARVKGMESGLTATGTQIGTPQYMSPEQAAGRVSGLSEASDVWALGAMFYQMLCGQPPYDGESSLAIMQGVITGPPPRWQPTSAREADLAVLVERCLQKNPSDRLPGAGVLAAETERWLEGEPIHSRRVSASEKAVRWGRRHPFTVFGLVLATAGLGLGWKFARAPTEIISPGAGIMISREGSEWHAKNVSGQHATMTIRQAAPGWIEFADRFRSAGMSGGAAGPSLSVPLEGITRIVVETGPGDDSVKVGGFPGDLFPELCLNGGAGDDLMVFEGPITFASGAGLDLDLQDDDPRPGTDSVELGYGTALHCSGTGKITVRSSARIWVGKDVSLRTADGGIMLEANGQPVATPGEFKGLEIVGGRIASEGKGLVSLSGRGGTAGIFQFGIYLTKGAVIQGGTAGVTTLTGTGGTSDMNDNSGFDMEENCRITTRGADLLIRGFGGGGPLSAYNHGIVMIGGLIQPKGLAGVTLEGRAGPTPGPASGVLLQGPTARVASSGGDITVIGRGVGTDGSGKGHGVNIWLGSTLQPGGTGSAIVEGSGQIGVLISEGGSIRSSGGDIHLKGAGHPGFPDIRIRLPGRVATPATSGRITLDGKLTDTDPGSVGPE